MAGKVTKQQRDDEALLQKHNLLPDLNRFARDEGGRQSFLAYTQATLAALRPLDRAINPEQIRQAVAAVHKVIQDAQVQLEKQFIMLPQGGKAKIACKAGCGWCCVVRVGAAPAEVLALADRLKRTLPDSDLELLKAEVQAYAWRLAPLGNEQKRAERMPCPLLQSESCSAHSHRPGNCRGYNSLDVLACKTGNTRPTHPIHKLVQQAANDALDRVLAHFGLPTQEAELVSALSIALTEESSWTAFLAGTNPFSFVPYPAILTDSGVAGDAS